MSGSKKASKSKSQTKVRKKPKPKIPKPRKTGAVLEPKLLPKSRKKPKKKNEGEDNENEADLVQTPKGNRRRKPNKSFRSYIFRLQTIEPDQPNFISISRNAIGIFNSIITDIYQKIEMEADRLVRKKLFETRQATTTLTPREIQSAVRFLFPGKLGTQAVAALTQAVTKYQESKA